MRKYLKKVVCETHNYTPYDLQHDRRIRVVRHQVEIEKMTIEDSIESIEDPSK